MALAGTLSTIADNQTTMAEMQVQTAQININNASQFSQDLAAGNAQLSQEVELYTLKTE